VQRGQVIARLAQDEMQSRIANQKALLADAQRSSGVMNNDGMIAQLRQKVATQQELVNRGLLTRSTLMATQQQLASLQQQGVGQESQIEQIKRNIRDLEVAAANASQVTSPYLGRVIEVVSNVGDLIGPGARLVTLEEMNAPIDTVLYIPAAEGKKVQPGMEVRVSPTTVKAEEYGFMIGKVTKVSEYPVTPEGLMRVLRNDSLAQTLASAGAPIEVKVQLIPDPTTPSGFRWSSSKGPPIKVASGTLCSGQVVVQKKRPISYVLPIFKSALGAS
jgi:HlyD family secretion protein